MLWLNLVPTFFHYHSGIYTIKLKWYIAPCILELTRWVEIRDMIFKSNCNLDKNKSMFKENVEKTTCYLLNFKKHKLLLTVIDWI